MKKSIFIICYVFSSFVYSQHPLNDQHWQLVFEDNFNTLNLNTWEVMDNFDHYGQPYIFTSRTSNVYISNGNLVLQANKERYYCPQNSWGCSRSYYDYTSGWIESKANYNIQYGYLESRIKTPYEYGLLPAFWTFCGLGMSNCQNAAEIDIFEMASYKSSTIMGTNLHMYYCDQARPCNDCERLYLNAPNCPQQDPRILCYGLDVTIPDYQDVYHAYALEWSPSKIIWYVDGVVVRNSLNPGIFDPVELIFNLGFTPWKMPNATTSFPSKMYIDYIRVYQLKYDANNSINASFYDFSTYNNLVKKSILVGNATSANSISAGSNVTLRATDFIQINGNFSIPLNTTFYMDVNSK